MILNFIIDIKNLFVLQVIYSFNKIINSKYGNGNY